MTIEISYQGETFPFAGNGKWQSLFDAHGTEVRGRPMVINWARYRSMERDGRLVWIVARERSSWIPVGYSGHYWYIDLHFCDKIAADDLWYVVPEHRGKGIGRRARQMGLDALAAMEVKTTSDLIRNGGPDLTHFGYEPWGTRWIRQL